MPDVSRSPRRPDGDPPVGRGRHRGLHQPVLGLLAGPSGLKATAVAQSVCRRVTYPR